MMELAFADRFFDDMEQVELKSKQDEIMDAIELLPAVPEMGSQSVPESVTEEFGPQVRKLVVSPFLVVYEIAEPEGQLRVYGLVHQRSAR